MDLPNLKELKALLKLCRSQGVTDLSLGGMVIKFGEMPYEIKGGERVPLQDGESSYPSEQEIADWSIPQGMPEDPLAERMKGQQ